MGTHPIFESDFDCLTDCMVTIQEIVVDGLDAAKHAFVKPEELPPRSPVQVVQEAGCGLGVGLLIGNVFKSVGQIAISTVGGGLVSLSGKLSPAIYRTCQPWTPECFFSSTTAGICKSRLETTRGRL